MLKGKSIDTKHLYLGGAIVVLAIAMIVSIVKYQSLKGKVDSFNGSIKAAQNEEQARRAVAQFINETESGLSANSADACFFGWFRNCSKGATRPRRVGPDPSEESLDYSNWLNNLYTPTPNYEEFY